MFFGILGLERLSIKVTLSTAANTSHLIYLEFRSRSAVPCCSCQFQPSAAMLPMLDVPGSGAGLFIRYSYGSLNASLTRDNDESQRRSGWRKQISVIFWSTRSCHCSFKWHPWQAFKSHRDVWHQAKLGNYASPPYGAYFHVMSIYADWFYSVALHLLWCSWTGQQLKKKWLPLSFLIFGMISS